jgi:hypothetical protein
MHTTTPRRLLNALMVCGMATALAHVAPAQTSPERSGSGVAPNSVQTRAPEAAGTIAAVERTRPTQERKAEASTVNSGNSATRNGQRGAMAGAMGLLSRNGYGRMSSDRAYSSKSGMNRGTRPHSVVRPGVITGAGPTPNAPGAFSVVQARRYSSIAATSSVRSSGLKPLAGTGVLGGPAVPDRGKLGGPAAIRDKAGINGSSQRRHF